MNILITGANGSLGEKLRADFESLNFNVVCASSNPDFGQKTFDLNSGFDHDLLVDIDYILHLAINPRLVVTNMEQKFLELANSQNKFLVYLGSTSSYLVNPNKYGTYKKEVENLVVENNGVVITCGLIYGNKFDGQVAKIKKLVNVLPFNIEFSASKYVYLTPIEAIVKFWFEAMNKKIYEGKRILLFHHDFIPFNLLLIRLARKKFFKIRFSSSLLNLIIKLNPFKMRYFSSDSYTALLSDFSSDLISDTIDLRKVVDKDFDLNELF